MDQGRWIAVQEQTCASLEFLLAALLQGILAFCNRERYRGCDRRFVFCVHILFHGSDFRAPAHKCWEIQANSRILKFPFFIAEGSNSLLIEGPGYHQSNPPQHPFSYMVHPDHTISVRGDIRNVSGAVVVSAEGDVVRAIAGSGYDVNSDYKAIEVVDESMTPVLQIRIMPHKEWKKLVNEGLKTLGIETKSNSLQVLIEAATRSDYAEIPDVKSVESNKPAKDSWQRIKDEWENIDEVVQLNYIFPWNGSYWCVTPFVSKGYVGNDEVAQWRQKIKRIFEYPGYKYPGKRISYPAQE